MSGPEDTMPPDPVASTIPSPPPSHRGPIAGPAWFFTEVGDPVYETGWPEWDGFASDALDEGDE